MPGMRGRVGDRHLVRAEGPLDPEAVHHLWPGPALGRAEDNHRPTRALLASLDAGLVLDAPDLADHRVECRRHRRVHRSRFVALDEVGGPSVAPEKLFELLPRDPGEEGRIGDLVAVEMQDRQHGAVGDRVEELVGMPGRRQRAGLRLAVADDAGDDKVRVVEGGPKGMAEGVAQLAALVDRAGAFRGDVAGNATGKGELEEQPCQSGLVPGDRRIDLAVGALEVGVADDRRPAVPGPGDVDHVEVMPADDPVQVDIDEVLPGRRAPVAQEHPLHVRQHQRPPQERVVAEIDLADGEVVRGAPVGVHPAEQLGRGVVWVSGHGGAWVGVPAGLHGVAWAGLRYVVGRPRFRLRTCAGGRLPAMGCNQNPNRPASEAVPSPVVLDLRIDPELRPAGGLRRRRLEWESRTVMYPVSRTECGRSQFVAIAAPSGR